MSEREAETMQEANESEREARPTSEEDGRSGAAAADAQRPVDEGEMSPAQADDDERAPLLPGDEAEQFRRRWEDLQTGFVDQPRQTVEEANKLVGALMQQLTEGFSEERSSLESQWDSGDDVSTEDLRVALTRYRSFFNRLLST
jgi:hypothetical protein